MYDILSYENRVNLVRALPKSLQTPGHITELFDETEEWGKEWADKLFKVVSEYDKELERDKAMVVVNPPKAPSVPKKAKTSH